MIAFVIKYGIVLVAGFVAGLLVGRKNKSVADKAQALADQTQAEIDALAQKARQQ